MLRDNEFLKVRMSPNYLVFTLIRKTPYLPDVACLLEVPKEKFARSQAMPIQLEMLIQYLQKAIDGRF